jgi:hypothetical protein
LISAEELIKAGADLTAFNNDGKTFLDNEHVLSYLYYLSYLSFLSFLSFLSYLSSLSYLSYFFTFDLSYLDNEHD